MTQEGEIGRQSAFVRFVGLPVGRLIAWLLLLVLGPFASWHRRRVPKKGGLLILSNHLADVDPLAVQVSCPRPVYFMAKSELFEMRILGSILRLYKAFSVKRGEPDRTAIKHAVNLLKAGEAVCVFPEGQLSETGQLQELKPGVALIVRMAGVPVICVGLSGTNGILPYGSVIPRPALRVIKAKWGEPRTFTKADETETIMAWAEDQLRGLTGQEAHSEPSEAASGFLGP